MTYRSIVEQRGTVSFPEFLGEHVYMREVRKSQPLPADLSRWQVTFDAMLDGVDTDGPIYLMIDQKVVVPGLTQRRPGLHIDGYWVPTLQAHSGGGRHRPGCLSDDWSDANFRESEGVILASSVTGARALRGSFKGQPNSGGDCSHIDVSGMEEVIMEAGSVYAGNVTMLHEGLSLHAGASRTLVRLNVPGWTPPLDTLTH